MGGQRQRADGDPAANGAGPERAVPPPPPPPDPAALFVLLDALRLAAPPELQDRLTALLREALLTLRALIDHYLERLDEPATERRVEDIPID
ncbi:MAG: hypothetical protein GXY03_06975 [Solirubrobacterales bacterium]|nr:hypothetical protein [Solirubrobacterales bacterium]